MTFSDLCSDALTHSEEINSKHHHYELTLKIAKLLKEFGNRPADRIKKADIERWLADHARERRWAAGTRNRWKACFSLIFTVGMENEKIYRNPVSLIRRKPEGGGRVRFLSDEEEERLDKVILRRFPRFLPHLKLSLNTGMRRGEQYGLLWSDVSFEQGVIHLPKTKNGHSRTIPLNSVAVAALEALKNDSKYVFPSARREDGSLTGPRAWFEEAVKEAGIEDYVWHSNRHTFASRLVMAGVDLRTVAELLGHRTLIMVMRYSHLAPQHQASAVERIVLTKKTATKSSTTAQYETGTKFETAVNQ